MPFALLDLQGLAPIAGGAERRVYQHPYDSSVIRQLDFFIDALADNHIILNDVSPRNIVLGQNAEGTTGLFLIDGFGSKQAVPVYAFSKALNRRRLQRKYQKMMFKLDRRVRNRLQLKG